MQNGTLRYTHAVNVVALPPLKAFWENPDFRDAETPIKEWYAVASKAVWPTPAAVKDKYGNASIIANNRVVFNLGGNKYRLITAIAYSTGTMFVKFIGTHAQYDQIDAATVEL